MGLAVLLGWASLIWDTQEHPEFESTLAEQWQTDGPVLPLEFSRISQSRACALRLAIDHQNGTPTRVAWRASRRTAWQEAADDLRGREETSQKHIHALAIKDGLPAVLDGDERALEAIGQWVKGRDISAVIWTGLPSNFPGKFSTDAARTHLKNLSGEGRAKAIEYVFRAPDFVSTRLRSALHNDPWYQEETRLWKSNN